MQQKKRSVTFVRETLKRLYDKNMTLELVKEKLRVKIAGLTFGSVFMLGLSFGFLLFPWIIKSLVSKVKNLNLQVHNKF